MWRGHPRERGGKRLLRSHVLGRRGILGEIQVAIGARFPTRLVSIIYSELGRKGVDELEFLIRLSRARVERWEAKLRSTFWGRVAVLV